MIFQKFDEDRQIAYGEVYVPNVLDSHGHFMTPETVIEMAHNALADSALHNIDFLHDNVQVKAHAVESFIVREGDPDFIPGAWVMGIKVDGADVWDKISRSEIAGFSVEIEATTKEVEIEVDIPERMEGVTFEQDGHTHRYYAELDEMGRVIGGHTDEVNGHSHKLSASSSTEVTNNHRHRFHHIDDLRKQAA